MVTLILQGTGFQPTQNQESAAVQYALELLSKNNLTPETLLSALQGEMMDKKRMDEIESLWDTAQNYAMRVCGTDRVSLVLV